MPRIAICLTGGALLALLAEGPAHAQAPGVTERLIELLVQKGVLPKDQAAALLAQAQAEARAARSTPAARAKPGATIAAAPPEPEVPPGTVRVTYVPELVRQQIADQVRTDVMQQARAQGWATPNTVPDWVSRVTVLGDMRLRFEPDMFASGNRGANGVPSYIPDFNTINNNGGFNTNANAPGPAYPPLLDTTQDRERFRVRARVGVQAQIADTVIGQFVVGTGNDSSPISFYDTFGAAGGNFSKPSLYLDKANFQYSPYPWLNFVGGRAQNPFWTTDLQYYVDLNFDGFSASADPLITEDFSLFGTVGAFPVFNSAFSLSLPTTGNQYPSRDRWLTAAQGGAEWHISDDYSAKLGVGYFNYSNIQGKLSSPCTILLSSDVCTSDTSRANFLQQGNTLFGVRDLVVNAQNFNVATPQLYGLASKFGILDVHGRFDINDFRPIGIALEGDFVKNLAFNRNDIVSRGPANNFGSNNAFQGGNTGYMARVIVGTPTITKLWDWNVGLTYKYLETDAVLDAVDDPDFHLGGTNEKGYIVGVNLGLTRNTYLNVRYLSANQISGQPYGVDVLQVDLNARF